MQLAMARSVFGLKMSVLSALADVRVVMVPRS